VKSKIFKIVVIVCILAAIAITVALIQYNKPHENIRISNPEMVISSEDLIKEFERDENTATRLYTDKIIEVSGFISDIDTTYGNNIVTLKEVDLKSGVICHMEPEEKLKISKLQKGQKISIKGKCSGFLMDVIMIRCIVINEKNV
jgi:hypothetical protein